MWAAGGGSRLWDREGFEWQDADKEVDHAEAERMLRSADVPVVISMGAGPLRWIDDVAERVAVWRSEIAPNFHDVAGWKPPRGAPGQLQFHATVWQRGDRRLLLVTDFD